MNKEVKIVGLSIKKGFGALKAVDLEFDENNHLTLIKGEVGAGKTTFKKATELVTKGSGVLKDNKLYGDNIEIETQLLDGDRNLFVGCKSDETGKLAYTLYEYDAEGKKVTNPVIDGVKATPAAYLKELQTKLTWRLDELTSENPVTQRNILLELYSFELEAQGVVFNKKSPNYVGGIIDQIEKAKDKRNYLDAKRKEVGGIADDLKKKGIDIEEERKLFNVKEIEKRILELTAEIQFKKTNVQQTRDNQLNTIKSKGIEITSKLKDLNALNVQTNTKLEARYKEGLDERKRSDLNISKSLTALQIELPEYTFEKVKSEIEDYFTGRIELVEPEYKKVLEFNEKGGISSPPDGFEKEISDLILEYRNTLKHFKELKEKPIEEVDVSDLEQQVVDLTKQQEFYEEQNKITEAVNSYKEWAAQNAVVNQLNKDYYLKLTEIETGVQGLKIVPEDMDIFLTYDGSYDPVYFANYKQELRKLSAYSDTQKPMICLLIQNYLLKKKKKKMPYLWIDQVPLDNKTIELLKKMSNELGLWLFVNWTGDFDKEDLQAGEILIENGEIFFN